MKYFGLILLISCYSEIALAEFDSLYFRGYKCTQDCAGHVAGYNWAIKNNLINPEQCGGKSDSFIEGCISVFVKGNPRDVVLIEFKKSKNFALGCVGSSGYGGNCYEGYGSDMSKCPVLCR